ncbi:MAG: exonuclease [Bacteroidetes bacterium]|nr:exonuclease [Bacteroidota bacterium]
MKDFVAIDFEIANRKRRSVCSVGLVVVRDGEITERYYSLIRPKPNYYAKCFKEIHGLSFWQTITAKSFPKVWQQLSVNIGDLPLVAHNKAFDESCLKSVYKAYKMEYPNYKFYCTLIASRQQVHDIPNHQLKTLAKHFSIDLVNHHNALEDAEACAKIALRLKFRK